MVARMVVGVATQNIEDETREQLSQRIPGIGETVANDFGQCFVAGVTRHHVIETEHRKGRHHCLSHPLIAIWQAIKSLDQEHVLVCRFCQFHGRNIHSGQSGQSHSDELGFDHAIQISAG